VDEVVLGGCDVLSNSKKIEFLEDREKVYTKKYLPEIQLALYLILFSVAFFIFVRLPDQIDTMLVVVLFILPIAISCILHSFGLRLWYVEDKIILNSTGIKYSSDLKPVHVDWEEIISITRLYDDEADEMCIRDSLEIQTSNGEIIRIRHHLEEIGPIIFQNAFNANYYRKPYEI